MHTLDHVEEQILMRFQSEYWMKLLAKQRRHSTWTLLRCLLRVSTPTACLHHRTFLIPIFQPSHLYLLRMSIHEQILVNSPWVHT